MTIKLKSIIENKENIKALCSVKLPIKISYSINKISSKIDKELEIYENTRINLLNKLGDKLEDNSYKIKSENIDEWTKEIELLTNQDVDIDFQKILISDLGDIEIEPKLLINWIFE